MENIKKDNYTYLTISSIEIEQIKRELKLKVIKEYNDETTFLNDLKPNELLKLLSKYKIERLLIQEITLEDLFMNYYK